MRTLLIALALCIAAPASAWDGTDTDTGGSVEIEKGNLVRTGRDIQIYDHEAGEYRDVQVENMTTTGSESRLRSTITTRANIASWKWKIDVLVASVPR